MSDWVECVLVDISEIQTGPFGSQLHASDYVEIGIPSIMPKNIGQKLNISLESIAYITEQDARRLERYRVKENDLVFSRRGDVEKCAFVTKNMAGWLCGTGCLKVEFNSKDVLPKFIAYYVSTIEVKKWLSNHAVGTTMPNLNTNILGQLPILLPPLPEQKAIADVLSSLDDKIDLLQRQNKTLEQLAQTLFRQWFIEEAQDEWEEGTLESCITLSSGKGLSRKDFIENGCVPVMGANGEIGRTDKILFNERLIFTGRVGTLGNVFISNEEVWLSDNTLVIKPKIERMFYFIYFLLKESHLEDYNVGSTQPLIRQSDIKGIELVIPSMIKVNEFEDYSTNIFTKINANVNQIRTLETLRDTLLPKLISGEIRVKF